MPRSHENYGQSRQLRARKTWTPVRACGPWDARTKLNLLRYCGHMHTVFLRGFYGFTTMFWRRGRNNPYGYRTVHVRARTVHVRAPYGPVGA